MPRQPEPAQAGAPFKGAVFPTEGGPAASHQPHAGARRRQDAAHSVPRAASQQRERPGRSQEPPSAVPRFEVIDPGAQTASAQVAQAPAAGSSPAIRAQNQHESSASGAAAQASAPAQSHAPAPHPVPARQRPDANAPVLASGDGTAAQAAPAPRPDTDEPSPQPARLTPQSGADEPTPQPNAPDALPHSDLALRSSAAQQPNALPQPDTIAVRVICGKRSARLRLPDDRPLADLLPDVARRLGVLDPTLVYAGYRLELADADGDGGGANNAPGVELDDSSTLAAQRIHPGARLRLVVGALDDQDMVYDDVVEAVGQAVERAHQPWTRRDTTLTALIISCGVLVASAACLAWVPASALSAAAAAAAAAAAMAALLGVAALLAARRLDAQALAIAMTACLFAAVCGWQSRALLPTGTAPAGTAFAGAVATPAAATPPVDALAVTLAGAGCLLAGGIAMAVVRRRRLFCAVAPMFGAALVVVGLLCLAMPRWQGRVWTLALAVVGLAATALPWLALSFSRLSVDSPMSEAEIFALPARIDIDEVRARYARGAALLFDLRAAAALFVVASLPAVVSASSPAGLLLALAVLGGMMLDSRRILARSQMLVTLAGAGIGVCVTAAVCARAHPDWTPFITVAFVVGALLCTLATQVSRRDSMTMVRLADAAEVCCAVAVPPLAYLALGW